ncbi:NAD(P)H-dependent oxidoreductase [Methylobacillus arboreus]|uniref:FMN-dependent NADH-azoreductase n=1 Tax=Methylobacillus arboreus TaxID=755170 RepID=UPI001E563AB8|nr:NAD(P)H-dependent oxidoreductase [Methylobacillus arboreus]MCB5191347.1 NAD(P)H-dependent oxidoreductase [Methylobacillus arboreus]
MMRNALVLLCSPHAKASSGWPVVASCLAQLELDNPGIEIRYRTLSAPGLPLPSAAYANAIMAGSPMDDPAFDLSGTLIRELEESDMLIIATPMHNFTIPACLKIWMDYVLRIHRTFTPTPAGKVGKLRDIPTLVVVASGGFHHGPRANQPDFLSPYLSFALNTIGIQSIQYVYLQGLAYGQDSVQYALNQTNDETVAAYSALLAVTGN